MENGDCEVNRIRIYLALLHFVGDPTIVIY